MLADERRQRELWLEASGPEVSSFSEICEMLWSDSGLADALEKPGPVYTAEIDNRLRDLHNLLRRIDRSRAPEEILKDPQLERARSMAQTLLQDLSRFGYDRDS